MSGYLARLAEKAVGAEPALVPVIAPLYGNAPRTRSLLPDEAEASTNSMSGLREEMLDLPQEPTQQTRVQTSGRPEAPAAPILSMRWLDERRENAIPREQAGSPHPHATVEGAIQPSMPFIKALRDLNDAQHSDVQPIRPARAMRNPETHGTQAPVRDPAVHEAENTASRPLRPDLRVTQPADHPDSPRERAASRRSAREISEATTRLDRMLARLRALSTPPESARDHVAHAPAPPAVRVSIGRIEVRAAPAPYVAPTPVREERKPTGPTLADYLAKRPRVTP